MSAPLTSPLGGDDLAKALRDAYGRGHAQAMKMANEAPERVGAYREKRDTWIAQYMARLPAAEPIAAAAEARVERQDGLAHWAKQIAFYTDGIGGAATPTVTLLRDLAENLNGRKIIENREGWARGLHSRADLLEEAAREIRKALAATPKSSPE